MTASIRAREERIQERTVPVIDLSFCAVLGGNQRLGRISTTYVVMEAKTSNLVVPATAVTDLENPSIKTRKIKARVIG